MATVSEMGKVPAIPESARTFDEEEDPSENTAKASGAEEDNHQEVGNLLDLQAVENDSGESVEISKRMWKKATPLTMQHQRCLAKAW